MPDHSTPRGDRDSDSLSRTTRQAAAIEWPTERIRAALVEAVCDGAHQPFSDEAIASQRDAADRLRRLVDACVCHLRDRGTPPERAVGFIKALIRETDIPCRRPLLALENQIMHWCIDAYYSVPDEHG